MDTVELVWILMILESADTYCGMSGQNALLFLESLSLLSHCSPLSRTLSGLLYNAAGTWTFWTPFLFTKWDSAACVVHRRHPVPDPVGLDGKCYIHHMKL